MSSPPSSPDHYTFPYPEIWAQLRISVPVTLGCLFNRIPWLISLSFVGRIGSKELAAAALATTICNVAGMSFGVGMSSAMTTLAAQSHGWVEKEGTVSQAGRAANANPLSSPQRDQGDLVVNGADEAAGEDSLATPELRRPLLSFGSKDEIDHESGLGEACEERYSGDCSEKLLPILPLVYLYRGVFILFILMFPIGCYFLYGVKPLLTTLGQGEELAGMTEQYLRLLVPGLWGFSVSFTAATWLQAMELAHVPTYASLLGLLLHVPLNLFFIHTARLGWLGVALATSLSQTIPPMAMLLYLVGTNHGRSRLLRPMGASHLSFWREAKMATSSLAGIWQYLSMALPGLLAISEWWASEVVVFMHRIFKSWMLSWRLAISSPFPGPT
ncbi:hypothetical protein ACHAWF_012230 [Thalassiosira exigua]